MSARGDDETLRLSGLHFRLVEPLDEAAPASDARRVRLLAVLSLVQATMTCVGALQASLFEPPGMSHVVVFVLGPTTIAYLCAYALARFGRINAAALLTLGLQCLVPTAVRFGLRELDLAGMSTAAWLSIAVLTANATLGTRGVVAAGLMAGASFLGVMLVSQGGTAEIAEGLLFLSSTAAATYAYSIHRDGVEATRREQLRVRNVALETLRSTLEARVRARTEELALKARELRRSCDNLHANQAVLLRTEKMAAVGRLTAGFAHELATPLSAMLACYEELEHLRAEYADSIGDATVHPDDHADIAADMAQALAVGKTAAARAIRFVRGMRAHTRDAGGCAPERFDVDAIAREAIELLAYQARAAHVRLALRSASEPLHLVGVPSRLSQVLTNLIQNAIDAVSELGRPGQVEVALARTNDHVIVRVEDDGPGIRPDVLPHVFEALFTTKPHGKGTGLGLAIVQEIVSGELGGRVTVDTAMGRGTTFVLEFPLAEKGQAHGPEATRG